MTILIVIFAVMTLLAGTVIVFNPEIIFGVIRNNLEKLGLYIFAIVVRLVLGVLLIHQSNLSKLPLEIEIIGWLSIVAAVALSLMGRSNFNRLMLWALLLAKPVGRIGGVLAMAFGAFLIYAFVS